MAASDDSLYPIAVLIDELKNEDIQVRFLLFIVYNCEFRHVALQSKVEMEKQKKKDNLPYDRNFLTLSNSQTTKQEKRCDSVFTSIDYFL